MSRRGEKIFKKGGEKGEKPKNWGVRGTKRLLYRRCGAIFRSGNLTSGSVARGALRAGTSIYRRLR